MAINNKFIIGLLCTLVFLGAALAEVFYEENFLDG